MTTNRFLATAKVALKKLRGTYSLTFLSTVPIHEINKLFISSYIHNIVGTTATNTPF